MIPAVKRKMAKQHPYMFIYRYSLVRCTIRSHMLIPLMALEGIILFY